jgi:ADP-L-glycero-D-manno-heptose 6-epimerase
MQKQDVIAITGAAGFIGSFLTGYLNSHGYTQLILVDDFSREDKALNLEGKQYLQQINRDTFFDWLKDNKVDCIFHLGARTDTTEMDYTVHKKLNLEYSKQIWQHCTNNNIPLVYASSAATYGNGEYGYTDSHEIVSKLQPLNPYGLSKNQFDEWALQQGATPPFWAGLKFFNVYGPNEYHKARMASVIFHAYNQVKSNGKVKLFRSHNPEYKDGEQMRDFIYVQDIVNICYWLMQHQPASGLYNAGTGKARSFNDLVKAVFSAMNVPVDIKYIDTPADIRDKYQYYTEANMQKLLNTGFDMPFHSLEEGINIYVKDFLQKGSYF